MLVQVNFMTSFNSSSFPDSLAIAKEGCMTIGAIDEIQKLHIRTVPLGEQPRRLAHQESSRSFVVLTSPSSGIAGAFPDTYGQQEQLLDSRIHCGKRSKHRALSISCFYLDIADSAWLQAVSESNTAGPNAIALSLRALGDAQIMQSTH